MADLINGLGGEAGFGENILGRNDDGSTSAIDVTSVFEEGLNFFGTTFTELFLNNNGNITFENALSQFTPTVIQGDSLPIIAAYFADVDTRNAEPVSPTPGGTSQGTNLVYYDLDDEAGIFTATWDDVGFFSSNNSLLNAFQIRLIDQGGGNFDIEFRYEDIQWTTGDASGGTDGLGGTPARAGFSSGNGTNFFELPQSGDVDALLDLPETVGVVRFDVRGGLVEIPVDAIDDAFDASADDPFVGSVVLDNGGGADQPEEAAQVVALNGRPDAIGLPAEIDSGAILTLNEDGTFTYDPNGAFPNDIDRPRIDQFEYTIAAGGVTDSAIVTIDVAPSDEPIVTPPVNDGNGDDRDGDGDGDDDGDDGPMDPDALNVIAGTDGDDVLGGTDAADRVFARPGNDLIQAGGGNDIVSGGEGDDIAGGGGGDDLISTGDGADEISGGAGNDSVRGFADDDALFGNAGDDILIGGSGDDVVRGGAGNDLIRGRSDDDALFGGIGMDTLRGDPGDDTLDGRAGDDTLLGNNGADVFVASAGDDRIIDFEDGVDLLDFSSTGAASFADLSVTGGAGSATIAYAGGALTLLGVSAAVIDAADAVF